MNPSTALAAVLVDELVRCGVSEVVLCPGSRSAPLAYAVHAAERAGLVRVHVRTDERTAAFLALGLAKVSRRPAVVITTSGTAVANLHPAVLEARHGAVPMILLTADRPHELRGVGANQTTRQPGLFTGAVTWETDIPAAGEEALWPGEQAVWRTSVDRAWAAATGCRGPWGVGVAGPAHLNVGFRDPLAPDLADPTGLPEAIAGREGGAPWTGSATSAERVGLFSGGAVPDVIRRLHAVRGREREERTLMVLGDLPDPVMAGQALGLAELSGWPVIAEPFGLGDRYHALPHGPLVLAAQDFVDAEPPERLFVVGRITLSRDVARLLRHPGVRVEVVSATDEWPDPGHVAATVHPWVELLEALYEADYNRVAYDVGPSGDPWTVRWREAAQRLSATMPEAIAASWPSGPAVAQGVLAALSSQDILVVGSSNTARDVDLARTDQRTMIVAGRGLAGIDGTVSTAVGIALAAAEGPAYARTTVVALMGDLTFLHDSNGLVIGPQEPRPDLTLVVVNDDGGGIFTTLEYGDPSRAEAFERFFATPTGVDIASLCAAHGAGHVLVSSQEELTEVLSAREPGSGIRVVEVRVPRDHHRSLREALRRQAAEAIEAPG